MATHPLRTGSLAPPGQPSIQLEALLDNIRSAWNVGSIIRTADGFGLKHVHLCGITPTPEVDAVKKTSLGAEDIVGWTHHKDALKLVQKLKVEGWEVLALEEDDRAISISKYTNSRSLKPTILIAGNEISGVDPDLLDLCDEILFIPMHGQKKSFNVTIAFGIAAYLLIKNG
jgi:23S rRNA (guanosine2251-2'-O)-methyltransferase